MARPRKPIDWDTVTKLCGLQCLQEEIANFMDVSLDTIERDCKRTHSISFAEFYRQKRGLGRVSLRRKQWEVAMTGDKTMLIWLGKQFLAQSDKIENTLDVIDRPAKALTDEELERELLDTE